MKKLIYDLDHKAIQKILNSWEEPDYRADQLWTGLYRHLWATPQEFTTLSLDLRDRLDNEFVFSHLQPAKVIRAKDGLTKKTLFHLPDGESIETVLMHYPYKDRPDRNTVCISTQVGCAMRCSFCATGQMGFHRQLSSGEIVEQVLISARFLKQSGETLTNVVVMGMGEPFHNYDATIDALRRLNHPEGMNIGARRFTISTVGLVPEIRRFAQEDLQVNLAISLHATEDDLRSSLLPINDQYPIREVIKACQDYIDITNRRVTFEWALIQNVNDSHEEASKLAQLLQGMLAHVNIIPLNPTQKYAGKGSPKERVLDFQATLEERGIPCSIRHRRGMEIQAGCGQLASSNV